MKRILLTLTLVLFIAPIAKPQDLPSNIPTDGLVAYYPFNGNANDESGNGNHGTNTDATLAYDRFDNENSAYSFDGDGDYIVSTSNVGLGQTTLTFSFWAKTEYGSKRMAALSQDCGEDCDNAFGLVLNKFLNSAVVCDDGHMGTSPQSFGYAQPSHYATVRTTTANSGWNNYVLIVGVDGDYSFNNFRFYVNGIEQITNCDHNWGNSQWQFNFPDYPLMIGNKPNSIEGYFHGEIDDVAIWNRALSYQEVYNLYDLPADILLDGVVSAENHLIKNVTNPVDAQDAATKSYVDSNINSFSGSYNDLTDKPTSFSGDLSGNVTSNFLKLNPLTQTEIDNLNPEVGTIVFNADSEKFIGYSGSAGHELDQSQENQNQLFDNPNTAQSFTAGSSGSLSKIDVKLSNGMYGQPDNNVTLTLREGEGTDGNVLFSTGLSTSSSTAEWISVDISGVEITQGSKYTIHLTSTSFIDEAFMWALDNTNPYPNGKSFYSNTAYIDYDLCFKTYISTTGWFDLN
jgi:hypothetical protein